MVLSLGFVLSFVASAVSVVLIFPVVGAVQEQIVCQSQTITESRLLVFSESSKNVSILNGENYTNLITTFAVSGVNGLTATGIGTDRQGNIYSSLQGQETLNLPDVVYKYSQDGILLQTYYNGNPFFQNIEDVAVDSQGNVYTVDVEINKVSKFSPTGTLLLQWGNDGTNSTSDLASFDIAVDEDDNIYLSDVTFLHKIHKFDSNGNPITDWSVSSNTDGLTVDSGIVYVNSNPSTIFLYDTDGNSITDFEDGGDNNRAIAVHNSLIYVGFSDQIKAFTQNGVELFSITGFVNISDIQFTGGTVTDTQSSCDTGKAIVTSAIGIVPVGLFFTLFLIFGNVGKFQ